MALSNLEFAEAAQPHAWYLVADSLHSQAVAIRSDAGRSYLIRRDTKMGIDSRWDWTDRTAFLLAGLALENLIKAYVVYENPSWISNGKLSGKLRTHKLVELAHLANSLPYRQKSMKTLQAFQEGIDSWARYPCALDVSRDSAQKVMSDKTWRGYRWLIRSYGKRMLRMLQVEWRGPHGLSVQYKIEGDWLGAS
jgi:hypothetical protein